MARSIHDNTLLRYAVDCEMREIRLYTEFRERIDVVECATVVFTGVEAYRFQHDSLYSIIFGIREVSAESLIESLFDEIVESHRMAGAPRFSPAEPEGMRAYLDAHPLRGFWLSASVGMWGWVLALDLQLIEEPDLPI